MFPLVFGIVKFKKMIITVKIPCFTKSFKNIYIWEILIRNPSLFGCSFMSNKGANFYFTV